ncbi:MAG TPA: hypothetical protein PKC40_10305 [Saprospiraceae bacterium]|nr:hypothetical protein [Saprospiraceae bacterium]
MKFSFPLLILAALFFSCDGGSAGKCKYGSPTPIFTPTTYSVSSHSFVAKGQESSEQIVFDNGIRLEIFQSGCNAIKQEFVYDLPAFPDAEPDWIFIAAELLKKYGELGEQFAPLVFWGEEISKKKQEIKLGETTELQDGHFVKVERLRFPEKSVMTVTLSEGEE